MVLNKFIKIIKIQIKKNNIYIISNIIIFLELNTYLEIQIIDII